MVMLRYLRPSVPANKVCLSKLGHVTRQRCAAESVKHLKRAQASCDLFIRKVLESGLKIYGNSHVSHKPNHQMRIWTANGEKEERSCGVALARQTWSFLSRMRSTNLVAENEGESPIYN
eukprot:s1144_g2.t1